MAWDGETLRWIYDRTDGRCHICRKKICISNYGCPGERGAWEVDHSHARAEGGSDYLRNLWPACISCNRSKGARNGRNARRQSGYEHAPLSREEKDQVRSRRATGGAIVGGLLGSLLGPGGTAIGAGLGALLGHEQDPDD